MKRYTSLWIIRYRLVVPCVLPVRLLDADPPGYLSSVGHSSATDALTVSP